MPASPDIRNYFIGKGIVSFKKVGDGSFRDLGNVPSFEFTPDLTTLDHFSSRSGVKTKDRTVVTEKSGTIKLTLEEWTAENMAIALLGDLDTNSEDQDVIEIFSQNSIEGQLKLTGTNEVGNKFEWLFPNVSFIPGSSINPITDEWGQIEIDGNVLANVNGSFGTVTKIGTESDVSSESDD